MIVINDIKAFIKKPDNFILHKPKKILLYSIVFKIVGFAFLLISMSYLAYFAIPSFCFFSASLIIDHKILKNIEPLIFIFIEKWINHDPDKVGFYMGRIIYMIYQANPAQRARGLYRGFFYQRNL